MLLSKVLHMAKEYGEDLIVMMVDTIKSVNYMSWEFLIKLMQKIRVDLAFINMVRATNASTTLAIRVQGK